MKRCLVSFRGVLGVLSSFCLGSLLLVGCSDDAATPKKDVGAKVDASKVDASKADGPKSDGTTPGQEASVGDSATADSSTPPGCDKDCNDFFDFHCVKDPTSGNCKACLEDSHCQGNPRAYGPFCDQTAMFCICKVEADCATRSTGKKCLQVGNFKTCTCETDADCPAPYTICEGTLVKNCVKRCVTHADCTRGGVTGTCDTQTGKCEFPQV